MIDKALRYPKERVMEPLARSLGRSIHPNSITVAACIVGVAAALAAWQQLYPLAVGLWLLNRLLDGLDGTLARMQGSQSDFGGYLDILLDVVVYAVVPLGLALGDGRPVALLALAALLGSFYINGAAWMYLAALLEKRRLGAATQGEMTTITMPTGLIEGAETVLFYTLFLLFPATIIPMFWLMAALVLVTVVQRFIWAVGVLTRVEDM